MLTPRFQFERVRSVAAPRTWPDAHLDLWGEFYTSRPEILASGVLFETFLFAPVEVLRALRLPAEAYLLAPNEIRVALGLPPVTVDELVDFIHRKCEQARELFEEAGARCSNGALIEKLRHNRVKRARHRRRDGEGRLL